MYFVSPYPCLCVLLVTVIFSTPWLLLLVFKSSFISSCGRKCQLLIIKAKVSPLSLSLSEDVKRMFQRVLSLWCRRYLPQSVGEFIDSPDCGFKKKDYLFDFEMNCRWHESGWNSYIKCFVTACSGATCDCWPLVCLVCLFYLTDPTSPVIITTKQFPSPLYHKLSANQIPAFRHTMRVGRQKVRHRVWRGEEDRKLVPCC